MPYYTPSTPAIERSPPAPGNTPILVCLSCGDTMEYRPHDPKTWSASGKAHLRLPFLQRVRYKGAHIHVNPSDHPLLEKLWPYRHLCLASTES